MFSNPPEVEWRTAADEEEWMLMQQAAESLDVGRSITLPGWPGLRRVIGGLGLVLLLAASTGYLHWRAQQVELTQLHTELRAVVEREMQMIQASEAELSDHLVDPQVSQAWQAHFQWEWHMVEPDRQDASFAPRIDIHSVQPQRNRAWVEVVMTAPAHDGTTREIHGTRFYRRTSAGWLRTTPDPAFWGAPHTLETAYFRFEFRSRDAAAVREVAAEVDDRYRTLRRTLGLPLPVSNADKLVVDVSVANAPLPNMHMAQDGKRIVLPSPAVQPAPPHLSDAEVLRQSLTLVLGEIVLEQWAPTLDGRYQSLDWQRLLAALRLWQIWESGNSIAVGRHALVQWAYGIPEERMHDPSQRLPQSYSQICDTFRWWNLSPRSLAIPLACSELDVRAWYGLDGPAYVSDLARYVPGEQGYGEVRFQPGEIIALATVIEYVVATYGREQVSALLNEFGRHRNWNTLIPAVFGVSVEEFEAGWHRYLAEEYDVPLP